MLICKLDLMQDPESIHYFEDSVVYTEKLTFTVSDGVSGNSNINHLLFAEITATFDAEMNVIYVDMLFSDENKKVISQICEFDSGIIQVLGDYIYLNHSAISNPIREIVASNGVVEGIDAEYKIVWPS